MNKARQEGERQMDLVEAAHPNEFEVFKAAVEKYMRQIGWNKTFTTADVIVWMGDAYGEMRQPKVLGPVMRALAREGKVGEVGYKVGTRRHGSPAKVWRVR